MLLSYLVSLRLAHDCGFAFFRAGLCFDFLVVSVMKTFRHFSTKKSVMNR